jgi:uncharacterized protein YneF (UPF0154 family)
MSFVYDPTKIANKYASKKKVKKLLKKNLSLNRTALNFVDQVDVLSKKDITDVALKTIKSYKKRIKEDPSITKELIADPRQLVQRIQNEVILQVHSEIKDKYAGKRARWLPSDADEPRPLHAKAYGKYYIIGEGLPVGEDGSNVEPGDEYGCRCGVEVITDETSLEL